MESSRESGWRQELGRLVQFCACRKPTIAICRVMLLSLFGVSREIEFGGKLVFAGQRAQFVPGRVLDLDAVFSALKFAQELDLARIEHAGRTFRRRRRFEISRELG